jgi:hypothetical protein
VHHHLNSPHLLTCPPPEIVYYSPSNISGNTRFAFELKYDYMTSTPCWFNLRPAQRDATDNSTDVGATSATFDYVADEGDHETFSLSGTSTPTAGASKTTGAGATATPGAGSDDASDSDSGGSSSSGDSSSSNDSLSGGAKAGIAIGVVALVGLAALTTWLLIDRRRRAQKEAVALGAGAQPGPPMSGPGGGPYPYYSSPSYSPAATAATPATPAVAAATSHGRPSMGMSVSPPSENNTLFSPFSTMGHMGGDPVSELPPPPPPAAEKPAATAAARNTLHELPTESQRYELDGVANTPHHKYAHMSGVGLDHWGGLESPVTTQSPASSHLRDYK